MPAHRVTPVEEQHLDVTVVLPAYNEVEHLLDEVERIESSFDASEYSYEILVIDDGSSDGTADLLPEIADRPNCRTIHLPVNRGSGYARRIGTQAAFGDVVVWTDADMTYPNDEMAQLVDGLGDYDQVVGARTSEQGTHKWARVPAKWFIRRLAQYLVETHIPDLNSGFRAFRREVALPYLHLLPNGFSCVTTITLAFLSHGHTIRYVDIDYAVRAGRSKFHWRKDTQRYVLQVLRMIMTFNPLRVFGPLSFLLLAVAVGKIGFDIVDKDFRITSNAIILTIVSLQVFATGLIADLVARIAVPTSAGDQRHVSS